MTGQSHFDWQKRRLPRTHILIWLKDKIRPDQIDSPIRAELPNLEQDRCLFYINVKTDSGYSCMKEGKCTKRFLRQFLN